MDNIRFSQGEVIIINNEKYDVVTLREEIDLYDSKKNKCIGEHTGIELHKFGDKRLHPTHTLKIYKDKPEEGFLMEIVFDKPQYIGKPRQRGIGWISYKNKQKILLKDIKQL